MNKNVLVVDLGTQSIRAAIITQDGKILGMSQIQQDVNSPRPGWAQQRPDSWWEGVCLAIRNVLADACVPLESIAGVCCCGQMHGPVGVDEHGRVTTEWTQIWCDKRCQEQCDAVLMKRKEADLTAITANPIHSGWVGLKVLWIKENHPDVYGRTRWFLVPKDFISFRLTGVAATDPSEASGTFLLDAATDTYSERMAEILGVDAAKFASIYPSHEVIGTVTESAAAQTGLPAGVPVVAGGGDFIVSMLGLGLAGEGYAADITGTSTLFVVHKERPLIDPNFSNLRHVVDGWLPFIMLDCGGLSMKWYRDVVRPAREANVSYEQLIGLASKIPPGSDGLYFYPYLLGERRRDNTRARGAFVGLTLNHHAGHMARAVMEGVAFAVGRTIRMFRDAGVTIERVCCSGGGTRNSLWNQIKADVYGLPLVLSDEPEGTIKGAALLAASGAGLIDDVAAAARERSVTSAIVEPVPENVVRYREHLAEFEHIYNHMVGFWQ
ncbi:MAG: hypothetical protein C4532_18390 [Candidatus Abyssobacteria bacterium SURF_17]|uniref:Xylulokinase n=1 Tax=Candidatus Abyssobacteria bacterium SURF_17 TaxID=2093361 RepID=A0A419EPQ3_9BACT|nr:MAG: hypothetical protein C4532_18390 [Candidatus Abyssubacteria bacterium SURF_17]